MQNKKVRLSVCRVWKLSPPLQLLACLLAHKTFALEGVKSLSWVSKREGGRVLEIWMTGKKAVSIS